MIRQENVRRVHGWTDLNGVERRAAFDESPRTVPTFRTGIGKGFRRWCRQCNKLTPVTSQQFASKEQPICPRCHNASLPKN